MLFLIDFEGRKYRAIIKNCLPVYQFKEQQQIDIK
jgi:hypothetical protein